MNEDENRAEQDKPTLVSIENEYSGSDFGEILDFDYQTIAELVADRVLTQENCPYEAEVSMTLVDEETIRSINQRTRSIDRVTDVLSFPMTQYRTPADFEEAEETEADSFDPESGRLLVGDIVICVPRIRQQAEEYGHSTKREFAFLTAHSMLHLIGYDHMTPEEEKDMFARQERALASLGITRESGQTKGAKKDGQDTV
ncbi:MAG: rRNA maturation RNase YbeY [Chordicoccus sp.]